MNKVWFITGTSKGIGKAIVLAALKDGDCVVATIRKENGISVPPEYSEQLLNVQLDVSDKDEKVYQNVVAVAIEKF